MKTGLSVNIIYFLLIFGLLILGCRNTSSETNTTGGSPEVKTPKDESLSPSVEKPLERNELKITKQQLGDDWVFTVDEGILSCIGVRGAGEVIFKSNGKIYAVNGTAKGTKQYLPIDEIWADDPEIKGAKRT